MEKLVGKLSSFGDSPAFHSAEGAVSFREVAERYSAMRGGAELSPGSVVLLRGEHSPDSAGALLALASLGAIVVPMLEGQDPIELSAATGASILATTKDGTLHLCPLSSTKDFALVEKLRERGVPGLVVFTSGSTGEPKAVLHDLDVLLENFLDKKPSGKKIASFNRFDKIAGLFMLFTSLSSGSCLVMLRSRQPHAVAAAIEEFGIQILPSSPSFLSLFLLSGAWRKHDLSRLELINYGSEPMTEFTLKGLREALPHVAFRQVFGTSELGLVKTKSESSDSLWLAPNDERVKFRVRDGKLEIQAPFSMLGYLGIENGQDRTEDGWMETGDHAEARGDWIRIFGRQAEVMKVGGTSFILSKWRA